MFCRPCRLRTSVYLTLALAAAMGLAMSHAFAGEVRYRVKRWTTDEGLPQNRVACLKQTPDGYLWIGTWFGLVRFNGVTFTVFNKFNTPELVDDTVNALEADESGALWIGTNLGLVQYRAHEFHRFTTAEGLPDTKVWRLAAVPGGAVWIHAGNSIARLKDGVFSHVWKVEDTTNSVRGLCKGADGRLNLVLKHGWLNIAPSGEEIRTNLWHDLGQENWLSAGWPAPTGGFWIAGNQGVNLLDLRTAQVTQRLELGESADCLYTDRAGNLWVGLHSGPLRVWDSRSWKTIDLGDLNEAGVTAIEEDKEGNVWVGTNQGLVQLLRLHVSSYTKRDGLPDDYVYSLCEGADGTIWVATLHGLGCIRNQQVAPLNVPEPELNARDRGVWPNAGGGVWVAKEKVGLLEFDKGEFWPRANESDFSASIGALFTDRDGELWVGTTRAIARFKNEKLEQLESPFGRTDIRSILQDREGTFWLGTKEAGLLQMSQGSFKRFTEQNGLSDNSVWSIHEDSAGSLWLGTASGLTRYRKGKFFAFSSEHGLLENEVNCVLEDDLGYLWLSTLQGLYRIKRTQLDAVADGTSSRVECAIIDTSAGMETSETNGERQPAGWKARDGRLWFPTIRGVVVVDPREMEVSEVPPPVSLEQVIIDGEVVYGDRVGAGDLGRHHMLRKRTAKAAPRSPITPLRLSAGRAKAVEFHFTANTFVAPRQARFRYQLSGTDAEWRESSEERVARYNNLPFGDYEFKVTAANHLGVWNSDPATFRFSLAKHFYETLPFYIGCAAAVLLVGGSIQAYRLRWERRIFQLKQERALADQRARIAQDLHDDLGTAMTGLGLELEIIGREVKGPQTITERLSRTAKYTRELAERMREVVWTVNPSCDTVPSLADFLEQQVAQFVGGDTMRVRLDFPDDIPKLPLSSGARHQLALAVREALTNVVRHAHATEVVLSLAIEFPEPTTEANNGNGCTLRVKVHDNGCGFQWLERQGHGLSNMRSRIEQVGGSFDCLSKPGQGTVVTFRLPVANEDSKAKGAA